MKISNIIFLFIVLFACKPDSKHVVDQMHVCKKQKMTISHYSGNAVAFMSNGGYETMIFIPVQEKDSEVFKKDCFDLFKAIKGRCRIKMMIPGLKQSLLECKSLKVLDREICNVQDYTHYAKIWISYKGYNEGPYRKLKEPESGSCGLRIIGDFDSDSAKILEFKIFDK